MKMSEISTQILPCANDQCFAGLIFQAKHIIAGDAVFDGSWNVWVLWSATDSDHNVFCGQNFFRLIFQDSNNGVLVLEIAQTVDIFDFSVNKTNH